MTVPPQQPPGWQLPGQPPPTAGWQPPGPGPQGQWQGPPQRQGPPAQWHGPAPAGWRPPPPVSWQPPQPAPAPVTGRIPDHLPFVVRQRVGKRALHLGALLLFLALVLACPIGMAIQDSGGAVSVIAVFGLVVVLFGALLGLQLYLITSGGPVLAVGPAGLWIKTRPTRGQAIWLRWEGIERIYRFEKMVCVKARDPRVGSNLGAFTALDSSMQQLFFGSGFTATVNFADKPEQEIMAALVYFSAGRCPIA